MSKYNPYQVLCMGINCDLYEECKNECILKNNVKKHIKGCNYSNSCKYCSHKNKCYLMKPYSDELYRTEVKRIVLEKENKKLYGYISEWNDIENKLEEYGVNSVNDVVYFEKNKQQMIDRIMNNERLIKAYLKKEEGLIKDMVI